jgi:hypothetical protein
MNPAQFLSMWEFTNSSDDGSDAELLLLLLLLLLEEESDEEEQRNIRQRFGSCPVESPNRIPNLFRQFS